MTLVKDSQAACSGVSRASRAACSGVSTSRHGESVQVSALRNADVTRYVTDPVTVPRPDPTRPDPLLVVAVACQGGGYYSIHRQGSSARRRMDGRSAARFGGGR